MWFISLVVLTAVWGVGCFSGYLLIKGINTIIKKPRIASVVLFVACIVIGAKFGLLGYAKESIAENIPSVFLLGISVPCGVVFWTEDNVLPV